MAAAGPPRSRAARSQEYGVSRRTSAHALTTLQEEGLIVAAKGKGFYVKRSKA